MPHMKRKEDTPQSVVGRTLAILDAFDHTGAGPTLSEISRSSGLPLSTTLRLITEMLEWGALVRTEDRRYWIGPRLVELATLAPPRAPGTHWWRASDQGDAAHLIGETMGSCEGHAGQRG